MTIFRDRWFLDRLATHILAFDGDSHVEWFKGNFDAHEGDKKRRLGVESLVRTGSSSRNSDGNLDTSHASGEACSHWTCM